MTFSIVVPTHNRRDALARLLHALGRLRTDERFEVIVVADGCTDETAMDVRTSTWPMPVHLLEQPGAGPASARNAGAAMASGDILLFLDDDVEPDDGVLAAHAAFHAGRVAGVGIGDLQAVVYARGAFATILRGWLEGMFDGPRKPGHRYTLRDLLTGHLSIRREFFETLGRFDESLQCHEDWELGYRAIRAGADIRFIADAVARHHDVTTLPKTLARKFAEGVADVQLVESHPDLMSSLPLSWPARGRRMELVRRLVWDAPAVGRSLAAVLKRLMSLYERAGLRFRWRAALEMLLELAYWRGVASGTGSRERFDALRAAAPKERPYEMVLDLSAGIDLCERQLDARRPASVRLTYGSWLVADVPAAPGAEPLRGAHLAQLIVTDYAPEFVAAASAAGAVPSALPDCPAVGRAGAVRKLSASSSEPNAA